MTFSHFRFIEIKLTESKKLSVFLKCFPCTNYSERRGRHTALPHPQVASSPQGHITRRQPSTPTLTPAANFLLPISLQWVLRTSRESARKTLRKSPWRFGPASVSDRANGCGARHKESKVRAENAHCQISVCSVFRHLGGFWQSVCGFFTATLSFESPWCSNVHCRSHAPVLSLGCLPPWFAQL